jgi:hypothetical protein
MKLHSVFLRRGCILPDRLDPGRQPIGEEWSVVEEIPALEFDTMIRRAGWHFNWLQGACSRRGLGLSQKVATRRALLRALQGVPKQFNCAELDSVHVKEYPGFLIVNVRVQPLHIQERAVLRSASAQHPKPVPAS